mmetsp:Transcript_2353/g.5507  ORF Transcript_2353/g.5507 Transcript_2353/m.5507 type:complete len:324 (+) Transcript_2353:1634-2605(+)
MGAGGKLPHGRWSWPSCRCRSSTLLWSRIRDGLNTRTLSVDARSRLRRGVRGKSWRARAHKYVDIPRSERNGVWVQPVPCWNVLLLFLRFFTRRLRGLGERQRGLCRTTSTTRRLFLRPVRVGRAPQFLPAVALGCFRTPLSFLCPVLDLAPLPLKALLMKQLLLLSQQGFLLFIDVPARRGAATSAAGRWHFLGRHGGTTSFHVLVFQNLLVLVVVPVWPTGAPACSCACCSSCALARARPRARTRATSPTAFSSTASAAFSFAMLTTTGSSTRAPSATASVSPPQSVMIVQHRSGPGPRPDPCRPVIVIPGSTFYMSRVYR